MWKALSILTLALLVIATSSAQTGVRSLTQQEAQACTGFDKAPAGMKCKEIFKSHECNAKNSITNCSGAGTPDDPNECKTCRLGAEPIQKKVWACKPQSGFECTVNDDPNEDCGTKWKGTCFLDAGTEDWFCKPTSDTTGQCTNDIKKICN